MILLYICIGSLYSGGTLRCTRIGFLRSGIVLRCTQVLCPICQRLELDLTPPSVVILALCSRKCLMYSIILVHYILILLTTSHGLCVLFFLKNTCYSLVFEYFNRRFNGTSHTNHVFPMQQTFTYFIHKDTHTNTRTHTHTHYFSYSCF